MIPSTSSPTAPVDVRGGPGVRIERVGTSTVVSLSDVVLTTGGSGPDFTVASADGKIRLQDGLSLLLRMDRANPTGPTLSVDGSPRVQWRDSIGLPILDGAMQAGSLQRAVYDASRGVFLGTQVGGPGSAGIAPDYSGSLAGRAAYDASPQGTTYLAVSDLPSGPAWTLYLKRSGTFGDWSDGLAIRASAAQTTVEAQSAADLAAQQAAAAATQAQASAASQSAAADHAADAAAAQAAAALRAQAAAASAADARALAAIGGGLAYDMGTLDVPAAPSSPFDFGIL